MNEETRKSVLEAVRRKSAAGSKKNRKTKKRNRANLPIPADNRQTALEKPSNPRDLNFPNVEDGPRVPGRPLWMPEALDLEKLPVEIRQAVAEIVQPAYEQLVMHAAPGLEKSLGASLVHLLWLEIVDQFDIKREYTKFTLALELPYDRQRSIDKHIRLLDAKLRHGKFMLRLEELRRHAEKTSLPCLPPGPDVKPSLPAADRENKCKPVENNLHGDRDDSIPFPELYYLSPDAVPPSPR